MMRRQIKLTRNNGDIVVGDGPLVVVLALIKIDKASGHPEIPSFVGIEALIKFFHPLRVGLATDADPLDGFLFHPREVDIQGNSLRQSFF